MRAIAFVALVSVGSIGCKTTEVKTDLAEGGAAGGMCGELDATKIKDPKRRARLMAFLLKMMMKDNPRATSLFLAATQNMEFDKFMVEWNQYLKTKNRAALLTKVDGTLTEADIDITVEEKVAQDATKGIKDGSRALGFPKAGGGEAFLDSALAQARLGEAFAAAMQQGAMTELEVQKEFESLVKESFAAESFNTAYVRTAAEREGLAQRRLALLEMLNNAAEKAGIGKSVTKDGVRVTVGISDAVLTRGFVEGMVELANSELNRPTSQGAGALRERFAEMERVWGRELVDKTKLRELVETIERGAKNKGDKKYSELQRDRALFDRLTNTADLMRELERRGESAIIKQAIERRAVEKRGRR